MHTRRSLLKILARLLAQPAGALPTAPLRHGRTIPVDGWVLLDTDLRELGLAA